MVNNCLVLHTFVSWSDGPLLRDRHFGSVDVESGLLINSLVHTEPIMDVPNDSVKKPLVVRKKFAVPPVKVACLEW